jgi:hypothetical protein
VRNQIIWGSSNMPKVAWFKKGKEQWIFSPSLHNPFRYKN